MNLKIKELIEKSIKKDLPLVKIGDTVKITVRIKEGTKERNQNYEGTVIKIKGHSINKTLTVRKVFQGIGVERVFFFHSPKIEKIQVLKSAKTRRAKLYYLRERVGKSTKLREKLATIEGTDGLPQEAIPEEGKLVEVK